MNDELIVDVGILEICMLKDLCLSTEQNANVGPIRWPCEYERHVDLSLLRFSQYLSRYHLQH